MTDDEKIARRRRLMIVLRTIVLVTGVFQLVFGEHLVGVAILLCLVAITLPALVTRGKIKAMPLEFEIILFVMVILQFVIGETLNFYDNVPYYDKFVHFSLPFFLGYISALLAYTMHANGNLRMTVGTGFVVIVLITLGIGAAWEIFEYLSDVFLHTQFQGSLSANALVDTMNDLIVDTLGGIFGALLALRFIWRGRVTGSSWLRRLTREISADFGVRRRRDL